MQLISERQESAISRALPFKQPTNWRLLILAFAIGLITGLSCKLL